MSKTLSIVDAGELIDLIGQLRIVLPHTVVQAQALRTPACYIGVIGSRHKAAGVRAVLKGQGFTDEQLDRIVTPIGLEIKAETPAEIAISIAGQLILHRAERNAM